MIAAGRLEVLFSDLPSKDGLPSQFHPPGLGMARAGPSRSIGPLPGGSEFFRVITGFKFLAPCIGKRASKSAAGRISGTGVADVQCHAAREPRWRHDDSGVKPEALVNQPPLHTHPALGRRLDQDDPGVRAPVICRTGVPCRSAQGTVCRSRSGRSRDSVLLLGNDDRAKMAPARSRRPC